jgi:hypothetical protein
VGNSTSGAGVSGNSTSGAGVSGNSTSGIGASGTSGDNYGLFGISTNNYGSYGFSFLSHGVVGETFDDNSSDVFAVNGKYGFGSSRRWKRNIKNISDPLQKLSKLRGVSFDWDEEHGGFQALGFIAEEVGEVLPEIVFYEENGVDAKGMDYTKITPLLVEASMLCEGNIRRNLSKNNQK